MAPKIRNGNVRVIKNVNSYKEFAEKLVANLSSKRGTLVDWESDMGRRIFYTDTKYPDYEFCIRTWNIEPLPNDPTVYWVKGYTISPEQMLRNQTSHEPEK